MDYKTIDFKGNREFKKEQEEKERFEKRLTAIKCIIANYGFKLFCRTDEELVIEFWDEDKDTMAYNLEMESDH